VLGYALGVTSVALQIVGNVPIDVDIE
jgi:hypothetical protein